MGIESFSFYLQRGKANCIFLFLRETNNQFENQLNASHSKITFKKLKITEITILDPSCIKFPYFGNYMKKSMFVRLAVLLPCLTGVIGDCVKLVRHGTLNILFLCKPFQIQAQLLLFRIITFNV